MAGGPPRTTHAIILVGGGDDRTLTNEVLKNLNEIECGLEAIKKKTHWGQGVTAITLADQWEEGAELRWYAKGKQHVVEAHVSEIDTGDVRPVGAFLAKALYAVREVPHVAIGFSGHGSGVFFEKDSVKDGSGPRSLAGPRMKRGTRHHTAAKSVSGLLRAGNRVIWVNQDCHPETDPDFYKDLERLLPGGPAIPHPTTPSAGGPEPGKLTTREIAEALGFAFKYSGRKEKTIDLLFFDSCSNCMVEVIDECGRFAEVAVASMNPEPTTLWDYTLWLNKMGDFEPRELSALQWGRQAVEAFRETYERDDQPRTLSAIRTDQTHRSGMVRAFKGLVKALEDEGPQGFDKATKAARTQGFGEAGMSRDMIDFAMHLKREVGGNGAVSRACDTLICAVQRAIFYSTCVGGSREDFEKYRNAAHGLAFWFPLARGFFTDHEETYGNLGFPKKTCWHQYLKTYLGPEVAAGEGRKPPVRPPRASDVRPLT